MVKNFADKRAPQDNPTTPATLPEGHPDLVFFNPYKVFISGSETSNKYLNSVPYSQSQAAYVGGGNSSETDAGDKLELSSIDANIEYIPKYDAVTKALTYWAVLKIKNTSITPEDTIGVEARVYVPGT